MSSESNPERRGFWKGIAGGIIVGGIALAIIGFTWGGWQTAGAAQKMANDQTLAGVNVFAAAILGSDCAKMAKADPESATLASITALTNPNQRVNEVAKTEWVKSDDVELSSANIRAVADACVKLLFPSAEANASTG